MGDELERTQEKRPGSFLVDGGYAAREQIEETAKRGTTVFAPVPEPRDKSVDRFAPNDADGEKAAEWRARMATPEAKEILKTRGQFAELPNANIKDKRGLDRFRVKGIFHVLTHTILVVLANNMQLPAVISALLS